MGKAICVAGFLFFSAVSFAELRYPEHPDARLTPGSYCKKPDSHRYPEHIPYCRRDVSKGEKWDVINRYNRELGYDINGGNRQQFKIDHLIPLCAGGSNEPANLWPQHERIYQQTDPMEGLACEKMAAGRLLQQRAVELIRRGKLDLSQIPAVIEELESL